MKKRVLSLLLSVTLAPAATQALPASAKTGNNNPLQRTESSFTFRDPTEQAFCERIAGWENVTLQDCFLLRTQSGNAQVLTPEHPYTIQYFRTGPYRITFSGDNVPKEEEVLEKWAEMLRDTSYRDQELHCTFKPAEYGYDVMANMGILLEECLKSFPQTESIDAQYAYRTDDRANHYDGGYAYDYSYCFQCDRTPVPEDFPSLDVASIRKDEPTGAWKLYLNNDQYSDYFAGFRTMLDSEIVKNLGFDYIITQLFDDRDDAQMDLPERTVVWERTISGDLDGDGSISAYDASLVLRGANEITAGIEAANRTLTPAQEALGDVDGDGELTAFDASCILRYYNLKYVAEIEGITWADVLPAK